MTETDDTIELECHEELDLDPVVYNFYDKYKASQYAPEHDHFGTRSKYDGMRIRAPLGMLQDVGEIRWT